MDKQFIEDIVAEVRDDYHKRAEARRQFEAQWQLNTNFVIGNQYCRISGGEVYETEKDYYWQEREVFNHLATIVETRLAKLSRVRPRLSVKPASSDDNDIKTAKVATKILSSACAKIGLADIISKANMWSELTGSAFYKVCWDNNGGKVVGQSENGEPIYEGEISVTVCPPYEIFPDALIASDISECNSIIHAKAVHTEQIKRIWGKVVKAEDTDLITLEGIGVIGGMGSSTAIAGAGRDKKNDRAIVIERYTRPSKEKPNGELVIIAGKELLYYGDLPYINGVDGTRDLPFARQNSITRAGCFFGTSMVERVIPIQRAYNAVKNRKHEFLNRIAMGVLTVEDGSVDTDNLESEGLSPGKILVYRQGANPPKLMSPGSVPADFTVEEQRLLNEFVDVSGISEIMRSSSVPSTVTSGVAIQMLVEQDDTRLTVTAENIREAVLSVGKQIVRLYRQFATEPRLIRFTGESGEVELIGFTKNDIGSDDIRFETENELLSTTASKQSMLFDLLKSGLLYDENGKLTDEMRYKILEVFGYGAWEQTQDVNGMHIARAQKENGKISEASVSEVDNHALHIAEHTKFFLSSDFAKLKAKDDKIEKLLIEHIRQHKSFAKIEKQMEQGVKFDE